MIGVVVILRSCFLIAHNLKNGKNTRLTVIFTITYFHILNYLLFCTTKNVKEKGCFIQCTLETHLMYFTKQ
jgi:hypothetical protein